MAGRDFPLPLASPLRERAEAWASAPGEAAPLRPAATVMFVRDGAGGIEVFMLKRVPTMAFAPSMHVFPGGGVDPRDAGADLPWSGPPPAQWAARVGVGEEAARMLVVAAAREVFEESGILLAGRDGGSVVEDLSGPGWRERRAALVARDLSFADLLLEEGLVLRSDLLSLRAHWVTPEFETRRYDTHFFAATVPNGQVADDDTSEAETAEWVRPADLLRRWADGEALLLPPTLVCLEDAAAAPDSATFVAQRPAVPAVMPRLVETTEGLVLRADEL